MATRLPEMDWQAPDLANTFALFKQRMELCLTDLDITNAKKQATKIKIAIGTEGLRRLNASGLSQNESDAPEHIWNFFNKQLNVNINFRIHRLELMRYRQKPEETIDEFITRCRAKSNQCDFKEDELNERVIELVIASTPYDGLQRELLQKPTGVKIGEVLTLGRQYEAIAAGRQCLADLTPMSNIDAIRRTQNGPRNTQSGPRTEDHEEHHATDRNLCGNCGLHHTPRRCPAYHDTCKKCGKIGHWAKLCRSGKPPTRSNWTRGRQGRVDALTHPYDQDNYPTDSMDRSDFASDKVFSSITISSLDGPPHATNTEAFTTIDIICPSLNGQQKLKAKIDTGAGGNTLPIRIMEDMYPHGRYKTIIKPCHVRLTAYNGSEIRCIGTVDIPCRYQASGWINQQFYVVDVTGPAILGLRGSTQLNVVTIHTVEPTRPPSGEPPMSEPQTQYSLNSIEDLQRIWPDQFDRIGNFKGPATIHLKENATPYIDAPRKCSIHLKNKLKAELDRMEADGVIRKVTHHTDWCSSITTSMKKDGSVRVCLDPKRLNASLKRCPHKIQTVEEINPEFSEAKFFTKLDAKSGYWSVHLDEESQELTTFRTPFGRYCYQRLPFGLSVSQDLFQQRMDAIIEQVPGCICIADDIVVIGHTEEEHDRNLRKLFETAAKEGLVFNSSKCTVKSKSISFFGTMYSDTGIRPDPQKVQDVHSMPTPQDKEDLQRFLGMMNFLSPYISNYADQVAILRDLLKKDVPFLWQEDHQTAFCKLKECIQQESVLEYYHPDAPVTLEVDASLKGLGACLSQKGKPVAYASKSLSASQASYSNIERETLALVFGITRFHTYLFGRDFKALTDHKPLVTICGKPLTSAPPRLQRLLIKVQGYNFTIEHKPGAEMIIADALSRLPNPQNTGDVPLDVHVGSILFDDIEDTVGIDLLHFGSAKQEELRVQTARDPTLQMVREFVHTGWPATIQELPNDIRPFWPFRDELGMSNGVIFKGRQILIPESMRHDILQQLHIGHQGMEKTRLLARQTVYWPNINHQIDDLIRSCDQCQKHMPQQRREPLIPHEIPMTPWTKIGMDLFELDRVQYLLLVDYHSKFPVTQRMTSTTSAGVAGVAASIFGLLGSPAEIISDNGPQFVGAAFQQMCRDWGITHTTSSPRYPQSNGLVERMVRTVKGTIKKTLATKQSTAAALLNLRCTPIDASLPSPAEMMFGRQIRSPLPTNLDSNTTYQGQMNQDHMEQRRQRMKTAYDASGGKQDLRPLQIGQTVWVLDQESHIWIPAEVTDVCGAPQTRSYIVTTPNGSRLRRNRVHLRDVPQMPSSAPSMPSGSIENNTNDVPATQQHQTTDTYVTRSGRASRKPARYC